LSGLEWVEDNASGGPGWLILCVHLAGPWCPVTVKYYYFECFLRLFLGEIIILLLPLFADAGPL
jgi:hypothetical protein